MKRENSKKQAAKFSGITMILSAAGIFVIHFWQGHSSEDLIMPFILLMCGIVVLFRKSEDSVRKIRMGKTASRLVVTTLSITLIAGILVMLAHI